MIRFFASGESLIRRRLPSLHETLNVFNVVLFAVFSWSIRGFLFELPAFLLYLGLGDIVAILSYMLGFALIESTSVLAILILISILLPQNWLKVGFAYKCFLIILVTTIGLILFQGYYKIGYFQNLINHDYTGFTPIVIGLIMSVVILMGLLLFFENRLRLQNYMTMLMDRFSVFGYIYIPLGLIGILVVLFRNIL